MIRLTGEEKQFFLVKIRDPNNHENVRELPMKIDFGAPYSTFPQEYAEKMKLDVHKSESYPEGKKKIFTWFKYEDRYLYDVEFANASRADWSFRSGVGENGKHVGVTARANKTKWGLLGMDFILAVKPLIIYGDEDIAGQVKGVDYIEKNLLQEITETKKTKIFNKEMSRK